jgi:uncharacterized protein
MSTQGVYAPIIDDPYADDITQPFWDAAQRGKLICSRCKGCGTMILPPQPRCYVCQGKDFDWAELPGTGSIYSFTVVRHPLRPDLKEAVPYVAAVVELDGTQGAGARLLTNIVDVDVETVRIGDKVKVRFDPISDTFTVPRAVKA